MCNILRRGWFDDLDQYCGVGFHRESKFIHYLTDMPGDGGVFSGMMTL